MVLSPIPQPSKIINNTFWLIVLTLLNNSASATPSRTELINGKLYAAGKKLTTLAEVEDYIEDNSEEVDLSTYFTKSDVAALFEELFEFSGTTLIIKDQ